jgi:glycosyltransferase involved in cell wall biosynthesis
MAISTTLVIPVLNEANSIGELLAAIEQQVQKPNEIIFVDGGSIDSTVPIMNSWASKHQSSDILVKIMVNRGGLPGSNRNMGIKNALNDWIIFLDAGISPRPNWISELVLYIQNIESSYAYGLCRFSGRSNFQRAICALTYGVGSVHPVIPASIFHKKVFDQVGYFPEHLRAGEDLVWMRNLAQAYGGINICSTALVEYVHFPDKVSDTIKKWFCVTKSVTFSGTRNMQLVIYLLIFLGLLLIFFWKPLVALITLLCYLLLRGLYDPIRRSAEKKWWGIYIRCIPLALFLACVIDFSKIVGAVYGYGCQLRK